ncbi:MAG: class I SAM-dependent methyltransferase [Thermosipho sp. (in: Bacteria)]|nr:class I SAM-dependent methyltransferase [Thermosipho sp. (in: thermotogales)]
MRFNIEEVFKVDDYMHFYSKFLTEERTKLEVENILSILKLQGNEKIIDLACGFGRHAVELSKLGFDVTGVDIMDEFLSLAIQKAKDQKTNVNFLKKDIRKLEYKEEFDVALLLFTSFGYFSEEENQLVLKNVSNLLKKNGKFLFDIPNRDSRATKFSDSVFEVDKDMMIDIPAFDPLNGYLNIRRIIIRNGKRREFEYSMRIYNLTEINKLLNEAGLIIKQVYGSWKKENFTPNSPRIIILAEKI